ncbi:hypothetical protein BS78_04G047000 [Paspalum vaginatum]|nr:hypothetical protein BS78_04G047000 [Paspalum vaginatum]
MAAAAPDVPSFDTELSFGVLNPAKITPREEKVAGGTPCTAAGAGGPTPTELQVAAILRMARRAAEGTTARGPPPGGDAHGLSMRRSLECFLERRRQEARRQHRVAVASPLSSSSSLTDG